MVKATVQFQTCFDAQFLLLLFIGSISNRHEIPILSEKVCRSGMPKELFI